MTIDCDPHWQTDPNNSLLLQLFNTSTEVSLAGKVYMTLPDPKTDAPLTHDRSEKFDHICLKTFDKITGENPNLKKVVTDCTNTKNFLGEFNVEGLINFSNNKFWFRVHYENKSQKTKREIPYKGTLRVIEGFAKMPIVTVEGQWSWDIATTKIQRLQNAMIVSD
jgi:hypothetical protein